MRHEGYWRIGMHVNWKARTGGSDEMIGVTSVISKKYLAV